MMNFFLFTSLFAEEPMKWDVQNPPGPKRNIAIDTTQGTWMSLDVSPDGKTLVFDLLGDIYTLPSKGGKATSITSGMAWDMQPQFSSDGKSIVFSSDRDGGDNIWVMDTDGGNPIAYTKEDFRLLNSPVWDPSSTYIAARKHYTKHRSLGTGEIWLYSKDMSKGIALTQKENDQKDVGEPHFSSDGKYIYFSKDATNGTTFTYNKDPNKQIYAIYRIHLENGETEFVVGGSGSALRPVPSPDNASLAYVRRIQEKTHLMIRDLTTGVEKSLSDILDHDLQETWAIHGVYPMFSFDQNGENIYFWAKGGIWKYEIATDKRTSIPFHVQDTRTVLSALQSPNKIPFKTFESKMLRGARISPDKKQVLFESNGYIWIWDRKKKKAQRWSNAQDGHEYDAQWSPNGEQILYNRWTDDGFSQLFLTNKKHTSTEIPLPKGHYREAIFSPDGGSIIVRRGSGGWLRSPLYAQDTGIYQYNMQAGTWERLLSSGENPHFGREPHYLYYNSNREDKKTLMRLDLRDRSTREIAHSEKSNLILMSPDEQNIAFHEAYNVHQVVYPPHSKSLSLSPSDKSLSVTTLSTNGAWNMQYSQDGSSLLWTQGNTLFSYSSTKEIASETIVLTIPMDKPEGTYAIQNARIITMDGDTIFDKGTLVWKEDTIFAVGSDIEVPKNTKIFDGTGKTIIPGLIDVHYHGAQSEDDIIPQQNWEHLSALSFGVTTIHDPSHDTESIFTAKELQMSGRILAPRIFSTGTILYGADSRSTAKIEKLEDALAHLRRQKSVGAFSVKSYNQPRRNQRQQIIEAARQENMRVMPEGGSLMMHNLTQIVDGHTGIEHAIPVAPLYEDVLQLWSQTSVGYTPTLGVAYGGLMGENYWYAKTDVWKDKRLRLFVPQPLLDADARRATKVPEDEYHHIRIAQSAYELQKRGVHIQLGAHGQREGLAAHWEMWMFAQGGMSPLDIIRAATIHGAEYLGLQEDLGSLKKGKKADFVILEKNPLDTIANTTSIEWTVLNGRVYDATNMNQLYPTEKKLSPLYFQQGPQPTKEKEHTCGCGIH